MLNDEGAQLGASSIRPKLQRDEADGESALESWAEEELPKNTLLGEWTKDEDYLRRI